MKKVFFLAVTCILLSCTREIRKSTNETVDSRGTYEAYAQLMTQIEQLNAGFETSPDTKGFPFNRWVSVCGDVSGFLFITLISGNVWAGLGVGAALSAILLPFDTSGMPGMPLEEKGKLTPGSIGAMHNQIITNTVSKHPQLFSYDPSLIYDFILEETLSLYPESINAQNPDYKTEAMRIYSEINRESVSSSFGYLKSKLPGKKAALEVIESGCSLMMNLDEEEIVHLYTEGFNDILNDAIIPQEEKDLIRDAISLTEGSDILWNFSGN